ncbi:hypothetical protein AB0O20_11925 [Streptomyces kronopolitis]|uniref:hypothetical protein n=1 Tax=Streptomyces kronopolitis TaxID=1612435 RepID=UPI00341C1AA0
MPTARYEVVQTDARTGKVVATLPVTGISYGETLNDTGSASVTIPLDAPEADPSSLVPLKSGLAVLRDGEPVWGGIYWTWSADLAQSTLTLNASGYHSYYKGVALVAGYSRKADQAHLLADWVKVGNDAGGIGTDTTRLTTTGRLRTRKWTKYEFKNVAEAIEELAEDAGGFNFRYEPYWTKDGRVGHRLLKTLRGGSPLAMTLEHGVNCDVTQVAGDGSALATDVYAIGADNGNGTKLLGTATNADLAKTMPRKSVVTTFSDVKKTDALVDKADAMRAVGSAPIAIPSLTVYPGMYTPADFTPGDSGTVRASYGYVQLTTDFVVTERQTAVDANGTELISLTLANKEVFTYGDAT